MSKSRILLVASLACVVALGLTLFRTPKAAKNSVLVLMLDTLRADHLGTYGYERNTSPVLDQFARDNLKFSYAVTAAPWTPPSIASMFTGVYPATHGWMPPNMRDKVRKMAVKLDDKLVTLAEIFKANGFSTAAVSPNPWITDEFGYQQGFDSFTEKVRAPAEEIIRIGEAKIDEMAATGKPFFAYLHFLDPHDPYTPPGAYKTAFNGPIPGGRSYPPKEVTNINLYDGEIQYLDDQLGKLFAHLDEKGLYDDLTIIIVGDHGEQFMERGQHGHGHQLFNEEVHVPLLVKSPRAKGPRVVDITTSTVDVFATALDAAGIEVPAGIPGVSLFNDQALEARQGVFTEIEKEFRQKSFTTPDGVKLIRQNNPDNTEVVVGVYDFRKDPGEREAIKDPEVIATLTHELSTTHQFALQGRIEGSETAKAQMKDSTVEQLKTLGYLQ
jgi:arylsulfatase A-like enzyme